MYAISVQFISLDHSHFSLSAAAGRIISVRNCKNKQVGL